MRVVPLLVAISIVLGCNARSDETTLEEGLNQALSVPSVPGSVEQRRGLESCLKDSWTNESPTMRASADFERGDTLKNPSEWYKEQWTQHGWTLTSDGLAVQREISGQTVRAHIQMYTGSSVFTLAVRFEPDKSC